MLFQKQSVLVLSCGGSGTGIYKFNITALEADTQSGNFRILWETNNSPGNVSGYSAILWLLLLSGSIGSFVVAMAFRSSAALWIVRFRLIINFGYNLIEGNDQTSSLYVCRKIIERYEIQTWFSLKRDSNPQSIVWEVEDGKRNLCVLLQKS